MVRVSQWMCKTGKLPYRTTTKNTLTCFHSMQKGLELWLGWRSDSVVFPVKLDKCNADGRQSKFLIQESRTRILVQDIWPCVISSRASFFSYEKLGWIRTMFYSVRETWSHVIVMLHRYWLEVRSVFFTIYCCWLLLVVSYFFVFLAILLIIDCYPEKIKYKILYLLCHRPRFSYEKLGCDLYTNFLYQVSRTRTSIEAVHCAACILQLPSHNP